jgi:predicted amidohydrolase
LETSPGQIADNYARAFAFLEHGARTYRPDVVLLPEAFAAYMAAPDMRSVAEPVPGPTTDRFCAYSSAYGAMIIFGIVRQDEQGRGVYNSAILVDGGQIIGVYDKTHHAMNLLPEQRALKNDQEIYLRGDRLGLFDTRFGRLGVLICHDGNFPEVFRALALEGARALLWIMNTTVDLSTWAKLHALWNSTPIFTCNRVQRDPAGGRRYGYSILADVRGNALDAAATAEAFLFADVDLDEQASFREAGLHVSANQMRVRRPELYGALTRAAALPAADTRQPGDAP